MNYYPDKKKSAVAETFTQIVCILFNFDRVFKAYTNKRILYPMSHIKVELALGLFKNHA
jgi:hypothetical protein